MKISMKVEEFKDFPQNELGPERIFKITERKSGILRGYLVIDNSVMGRPCVGGTFMLDEIKLEEVRAKARNMTIKNALAELKETVLPTPDGINCIRWGGSKLGIVGKDEERKNFKIKAQIIRGVARALFKARIIPQLHLFGLDINITEKEADLVIRELGSNRVVAGCSKKFGGVPFNQLGITGFGGVIAGETLAKRLNVTLDKATHVVQGTGAVGKGVLKELAKRKARLIAVSDLNPKNVAIYNPRGLEFREVFRSLKETGSVANYKLKHEEIPLGQELFLPTDFIWYAAKENVITEPQQAKKLTALFHIEVANLPISLECEKILIDQGCYIAVDVATNVGGILAAYIEQIFMDRLSVKEKVDLALREVAFTTSRVPLKIMERAQKEKKAPREIAIEIVKEKIRKVKRNEKF